MLLILQRVASGGVQWLGSSVLEFEIDRMPSPDRLRRVREMLADVSRWVQVEETDIARGEELEGLGFSDFDALHLACAERGGAETFLTTDDKLLRRAERHAHQLRVQAVNPVNWISQEEP